MVSIRIALPKGHLWDSAKGLLDKAGYNIRMLNERSYFAYSNDPELEMRIYRAQNIPPLVEEGKYDLGISGLDWVLEHGSNLEELLDVEFGKVHIIAAIPQSYGIKALADLKEKDDEILKEFVTKMSKEGHRIIVASEYERLTRKLMDEKFAIKKIPYKFIRSYGATEAFVKDADLIIDCVQTGKTLQDNGWEPIYKLFSSTARIIANKESLKDKQKREKIENFLTMVRGAKDALRLRLLKMNVSEKALKNVLDVLPAMKSPTVSKLSGKDDYRYAIETAVPADEVVQIIPILKKKGATDILEIDLEKAVS